MCNLDGDNPRALYPGSVSVNGVPVAKESEKIGSSVAGVNGHVGGIGGEKDRDKRKDSAQLEVLWDDGFGSASMKDYLDIAKDMTKPDGGPPRWFSPVECGRPLKGSPLLLFLPGNLHLTLAAFALCLTSVQHLGWSMIFILLF